MESTDGVIRSPAKRQMPTNIRDYLGLEDEEPERQFVDNFTIL